MKKTTPVPVRQLVPGEPQSPAGIGVVEVSHMPETRLLKTKDRLIALMEIGGASNSEIAAAHGCSTSYVSMVQKSPLYQAMLQDLRERLEAKVIDDLADVNREITSQAMASVKKIVGMRDNSTGDVPHAVQLGAAQALLDRAVPKKSEASIDQRTVVVISDEGAARMAAVLAEAGMRTRPIEAAVPRPLDQAITDAQVAENISTSDA